MVWSSGVGSGVGRRFHRRPRQVRVSNDGRFRECAVFAFHAEHAAAARPASQDHVRVGARGAQLLLGLPWMVDLGTGTCAIVVILILVVILIFILIVVIVVVVVVVVVRRLPPNASAARRYCVRTQMVRRHAFDCRRRCRPPRRGMDRLDRTVFVRHRVRANESGRRRARRGGHQHKLRPRAVAPAHRKRPRARRRSQGHNYVHVHVHVHVHVPARSRHARAATRMGACAVQIAASTGVHASARAVGTPSAARMDWYRGGCWRRSRGRSRSRIRSRSRGIGRVEVMERARYAES